MEEVLQDLIIKLIVANTFYNFQNILLFANTLDFNTKIPRNQDILIHLQARLLNSNMSSSRSRITQPPPNPQLGFPVLPGNRRCFFHLVVYHCGCRLRSEDTRFDQCPACSSTWACAPHVIQDNAATECPNHAGFCHIITEKFTLCDHVVSLPKPVRREGCPACKPLRKCTFKNIVRLRNGRCRPCILAMERAGIDTMLIERLLGHDWHRLEDPLAPPEQLEMPPPPPPRAPFGRRRW